MFGNSNANKQRLASEPTIDPECGCTDVPKSSVVAAPDAGRQCYGCHTPFQIGAWDDVLDGTRITHPRGRVSTYNQHLIGLDAAGRTVYHDTQARDLLTVVPKHHYAYRDDVSSDAPVLRRYAQLSIGSPLNAPDGDVLTIVDRTDIGHIHCGQRLLPEYLIDVVPGRTPRTRWDALSDHALRKLRRMSNRRSSEHYPVDEGRALARLYSGNNRPFQELF